MGASTSTLRSELEQLEQAVRTIKRLVQSAAPGSVSGDEARSLVRLFAGAERAAASGVALYAPVVVETGSYAKEGHGSPADWLGAVSGSSAGTAKSRLVAADRASHSPDVAERLRRAELSSAQLKLVTDTVAVAPEAAAVLLPLVEDKASHQELCDAAARARQATQCRESARARRERVHGRRHFTWHADPNGGIRGEFLCDEVAWSKVAPRLESVAKERWRAAGSDTQLNAHRLDAFIEIMDAGGGDGGAGRPQVLVVVDAKALRRGETRGQELCEIDGIGAVSVDAARELLGEGATQFLIRDGVDIRTVTSSSRSVAQRVEMALVVRDRICVVPGCGKRLGLEKDHWVSDFGKGGPTELANLARLCGPHHDMKTHGGWRLSGGPGRWAWDPPPDPPSAGFIARSRRVAAARYRPLQT